MRQKLDTILAQGAQPQAAGPQVPAAAPVAATPAPVGAPAVEPAPLAAAPVDPFLALRQRNDAIRAAAAPHLDQPGVRELVDNVMAAANPADTVEAVGTRILALVGAARQPLAGNGAVLAGADARDKQRDALGAAIAFRGGVDRKVDAANPFRGHTLTDMARASLELAGASVRGLDRMELVAMAFTHSSSDFPQLLADTAHKALLRGYEGAAETFPTWTRPVSVSDFKPTTLAGLGLFSGLDQIAENGEYKHGKFSEAGAAIQLATFGKMFGLSRQAIINDDLGALIEVPRKMGAAAKRKVGDAVYGVLTANAALADGVALFHADHANLLAAGSILTATVDGVRVAFATQTDADGNVVYVPLKYLVTPVALGGAARTVRDSLVEVIAGKTATSPNTVRGTFEVVDDGRLDAASASVWYGVGDGDGIVVAYLDGKQEPYLEQKDRWNADGVEFKVRIDAAAGVADYRGLVRVGP